MADFLLIHGSCHGAWCWDATTRALEELGHHACAIDLPGHGADPTPPEDVTLEHYAKAIDEALDGSVHLVGHSMAGFAIAAAAERAADRISSLIYLAALPPLPGKSIVDIQRMHPDQPLRDAIRISEDRKTWWPDPQTGAERFYHDVPADIAIAAMARLTPEPMAPQITPIHPQKALTLRRHYILCEEDHAVATALQEMLCKDWQGGKVIRLASSHSPFLSCPKALAKALARLAEE